MYVHKYRKYRKSPSNLRLGAEGSQHDLRHRWILLLDGRPPRGRSSADERSRGQQRVPWLMEQTQVRFLERRMDHDFEQIQNDSSTNMNSLQGD